MKQNISISSRAALKRKYHHLYVRPSHIREDKCTYCGDISVCFDHVPSLYSVGELGTKFFVEKEIDFFILPSCQECNLLLGNRFLYTYQDRVSYLAKRILKRHKRKINVKTWNEEELEDLGNGLKKFIENSVINNNFQRKRYEYLRAMANNEVEFKVLCVIDI